MVYSSFSRMAPIGMSLSSARQLQAKTIGDMRQVMVRGLQKVDQMFVLTMAAYNLTRMRTLGQLRRPEAAQ